MRLRAHQRAMKTDEVCDRPRHPFAADTPPLDFSRSKGNADDSPCRNASTYKEVLPCP
nr:MAG TPA: hypothetical protein [Bacteriophage sp.]